MNDWRYKDKKYRVLINDDNLLSLFLDYRGFEMIRIPEHIDIEQQFGLNCMYLLDVDNNDIEMFEYFGATIETYTAL